MKKKFTFGLVAVCGLVLAGCYGGSSATSSSSAKSGSADGGGVFNLVVPQEMPTADLSVATDTISFTALNNVYEEFTVLMKTANHSRQELASWQKSVKTD